MKLLGSALVALVLVAALPWAASAQSQHRRADAASRTFVFGYQGGNMATSTVTIYDNGKISIDGPLANSARPTVHLSKYSLKALMKLANAEGFFFMPNLIKGGIFADAGSRYVGIATTSGIYKVVEQPTQHPRALNQRFDELFYLLLQVAGICTAPGEVC